jgi:hypothetical protein
VAFGAAKREFAAALGVELRDGDDDDGFEESIIAEFPGLVVNLYGVLAGQVTLEGGQAWFDATQRYGKALPTE